MKMEALLLERAEIEAELAEPAPTKDLRERLATLNKDLEDVAGNYKESEAMLELLASRRLSREREIKTGLRRAGGFRRKTYSSKGS